jgi:hypothetical protein
MDNVDFLKVIIKNLTGSIKRRVAWVWQHHKPDI